MDLQKEAIQPRYRFSLRGRIHTVGFRTLSEFSKAVGIDIARISRICSGWEIPSPALQQNMAEHLGMTIKEFRELL